MLFKDLVKIIKFIGFFIVKMQLSSSCQGPKSYRPPYCRGLSLIFRKFWHRVLLIGGVSLDRWALLDHAGLLRRDASRKDNEYHDVLAIINKYKKVHSKGAIF